LKGLLSSFKDTSSEKRNRTTMKEGKIEGGALGCLWKKQKSQGQCDFLEPNKSTSQRTVRGQRAQRFFVLWAAGTSFGQSTGWSGLGNLAK
jgi:hypothetical protein